MDPILLNKVFIHHDNYSIYTTIENKYMRIESHLGEIYYKINFDGDSKIKIIDSDETAEHPISKEIEQNDLYQLESRKEIFEFAGINEQVQHVKWHVSSYEIVGSDDRYYYLLIRINGGIPQRIAVNTGQRILINTYRFLHLCLHWYPVSDLTSQPDEYIDTVFDDGIHPKETVRGVLYEDEEYIVTKSVGVLTCFFS